MVSPLSHAEEPELNRTTSNANTLYTSSSSRCLHHHLPVPRQQAPRTCRRLPLLRRCHCHACRHARLLFHTLVPRQRTRRATRFCAGGIDTVRSGEYLDDPCLVAIHYLQNDCGYHRDLHLETGSQAVIASDLTANLPSRVYRS